jgi:haloacid dehalogenase-like hydrolase
VGLAPHLLSSAFRVRPRRRPGCGAHPGWKTKHPFKAVLTGDQEAMDKFTLINVGAIALATHTGMTTEAFQSIVRDWMATARHPRFDKHYSEMVYQPMLEVMRYLRNNGHKTYIVTGGGQDLVRTYSGQVYDIQPQQIIGSALETFYEYKNGQGILMREPKVLLDNDFARKPAVIYLFLGRHPRAAFGNSIRRPADARIHSGLWRSVAGNAGYCTTTRNASIPTAQPRACRIRWSGPLRKRCTTKPRTVGRSSA